MKAMVQLSKDEVSQLQYPVVVETWKRRLTISNKRKWLATFSETERTLAEEVYKQFYHWHIFSGPTAVVMSPEKLVWIQTKLIPFFANL
jgi:hypothetical protein